MIAILIAVLLAAVVYWLCLLLGLPAIVGIVAAILVLISGVGTGGYGLRPGARSRICRRPRRCRPRARRLRRRREARLLAVPPPRAQRRGGGADLLRHDVA